MIAPRPKSAIAVSQELDPPSDLSPTTWWAEFLRRRAMGIYPSRSYLSDHVDRFVLGLVIRPGLYLGQEAHANELDRKKH